MSGNKKTNEKVIQGLGLFFGGLGFAVFILGGGACENAGPAVGPGTDGDADGDIDGDTDGDGDGDTSDTNPGDSSDDTTDSTNVICEGVLTAEGCIVFDPACGDGEINVAGELCDDGNTLPGDGCTGICKIEPHWICPTEGQPCELQIICGNGVVESGEECDDGNPVNDDGCSSCIQSVNYECPDEGQPCNRIVDCGDGRIGGDETCEDGNTVSGDGCDSNCHREDGWVCLTPGQACKLGNICGDRTLSVVDKEVCDDGNTVGGDGCAADCLSIESGYVCPTPGELCQNTTVCGDGRVSGTETCDDANDDPADGCDNCALQDGYECPFPGAKCLAKCGDGMTILNEECDDGNTSNEDGCTSTCEWEDGFVCTGTPPTYDCRPTVCGDTVVEGTEACDDGNNNMGDGCTPFCDKEPLCESGACTSTCGDALVLESVGEQCDDGNAREGDGCSSACQIESGFQCEQPPLGETMSVPIVYRDFPGTHVDFENGVTGSTEATLQLVDDTLDAEGKPVYIGTSSEGHIASASSFAEWFRDSASVNATIVDMLTLYDNGNNGYVNRWGDNGEQFPYYTDAVWCGAGGSNCSTCDTEGTAYDVCLDPCTYWGNGNTDACGVMVTYMDGDPLFFPLDDVANPDPVMAAKVPPPYADSWPLEDPAVDHNFSFTSEVRYWFQYNADQTYTLAFLGDDDVWVFLNNRLAVDIGGIHTPVSGILELSTPADGTAFGLTDGQVYEVVVFQAERQTDCSSYQLTLSGFNAAESDCGPICGDGIMSPGEQCDNGDAENTGGYGKCSSDCTRGPYCGDAEPQTDIDPETSEPYEQCDDGLNISSYAVNQTDGCSPGCLLPPYCGDSIIQSAFGELCDNGVNDGSYNGCSATCGYGPWCGDGIVQSDYEVCDDGLNDGTYNTCAPGCVLGDRCGDGVLQEDWGEECEIGEDNCSNKCRKLGTCGDGVMGDGEECDDGVNDGGYGECGAGCKIGQYCGDGVVQNEYEECDDTINDGGYGECSIGCKLGPYCGDSEVETSINPDTQEPYEECDEGVNNGADGVMCTTGCKEIIIIPV